MASYEEHPSKTTGWRNGELVVLPDAAAEDCTVWFWDESDTTDGLTWEGLLARKTGSDRARICAIPFWIYNLNLGDEVATVESAEGALVACGMLHDAGNHTFRVYRKNAASNDWWLELMSELEPFDCWFDVRSSDFLALSAPQSHAQVVADFLRDRELRGEWQYENGRSESAPGHSDLERGP